MFILMPFCGFSELLGFRTLSIVRYSRNWKAQYFWNWICFLLYMRGGIPTLLSHSETANFSHWTNNSEYYKPAAQPYSIYWYKFWLLPQNVLI
jgi:hypothetical protein